MRWHSAERYLLMLLRAGMQGTRVEVPELGEVWTISRETAD